MRGAEGEAVLSVLRTLRNKADAAGSARPKGKNASCLLDEYSETEGSFFFSYKAQLKLELNDPFAFL